MATITAPNTIGRVPQTRLTTRLGLANTAGVSVHVSNTFDQTGLLPAQFVQPPSLATVGFLVPNTFNPMFTGDTRPLVLDMFTLTRDKLDNIILRLPVESAVKVDAAVVVDGGVTEPVQVRTKVPWYGVIQTGPGIT